MLSIPFMLAAGSLPTLISGLPVPSFLSGIVETVKHSHFLEARESATSYTVYGGTGEATDGWPAMSDWISSFDTMFANQKSVMSTSCAQWDVPNNTDDEMSEMSSAIKSVASSTGIDPRFILAIIMQESNGCVRAPTTNYGVRNPGLMQSHNGAGTCNDASVSNPCPSSQITQMIQDGSAGTASGDGLKQCLAETGATDVSMYYKAARIYNSGSIAAGGNLGAGIATHCYASDIANRLTGWASGPSSCQAGTIAELTGTVTSGSSGSSDSPSAAAPAPTTSKAPLVPSTTASIPGGAFAQTTAAPKPTTTTPTTTVVPVPVATAAPKPVAPAPSSKPDSSGPTPPPSSSYGAYPGATASCQEWDLVQAGDYCDLLDSKFGITFSQFTSWNSGLDATCSNLWLGYQYCVKA